MTTPSPSGRRLGAPWKTLLRWLDLLSAYSDLVAGRLTWRCSRRSASVARLRRLPLPLAAERWYVGRTVVAADLPPWLVHGVALCALLAQSACSRGSATLSSAGTAPTSTPTESAPSPT